MERGRESEDNGGGGGVGEWFTGAADAGYADGALRDMARDLEAVDAAWERWNGRGGGVGGGSGGNFSGGVGGGGGRKHGREARVEGQARVEGAHSGQSGPAGVCQDRAQQDGAEQPTKRARVCQNESAAGGACDEEERRAGVGAAKNLDTAQNGLSDAPDQGVDDGLGDLGQQDGLSEDDMAEHLPPDHMSDAIRRQLWTSDPRLAHDPYTARVMAAHTREKLVYTLGFAEQFAAAKARARVGGGEVGDADVLCLMERLWGVYVPTCVDHADALLASVLPVNLSAANLSFEVPRCIQERRRQEEERHLALYPHTKYKSIKSEDGSYVYLPPELVEHHFQQQERAEAEASLPPFILEVIEEARQEEQHRRANAAKWLPKEHPFKQYWLKDSPEEAIAKNKLLLEDFLRRNPN